MLNPFARSKKETDLGKPGDKPAIIPTVLKQPEKKEELVPAAKTELTFYESSIKEMMVQKQCSIEKAIWILSNPSK